MPIYEYECGKCRCRFEMKQSFDAETVAICSLCGGQARRILHPTPLLFKGSGFYITDSRKGKEPREETPKAEASKKETPKAQTASSEKPKGK